VIFVTVGAQTPFDRLVHAVDAWAKERGRDDVFAQIGSSDRPPPYLRWAKFLDPHDFLAMYRDAELVVAHAGTGSILQALELGKRIVVMPRRAALGETRNDHQLATAERFRALGRIPVAWDEAELAPLLDRANGIDAPAAHLGPHASPELLDALRAFLRAA
jgi:UDP-N-acetylglucosamine transferase subunit ALG13